MGEIGWSPTVTLGCLVLIVFILGPDLIVDPLWGFSVNLLLAKLRLKLQANNKIALFPL